MEVWSGCGTKGCCESSEGSVVSTRRETQYRFMIPIRWVYSSSFPAALPPSSPPILIPGVNEGSM